MDSFSPTDAQFFVSKYVSAWIVSRLRELSVVFASFPTMSRKCTMSNGRSFFVVGELNFADAFSPQPTKPMLEAAARRDVSDSLTRGVQQLDVKHVKDKARPC